MLTEFFDRYAATYGAYKGGAWCYEDGLIYRGLELLHRATGEERWLAHLMRLITPQLLPGPALRGYSLSDYNIDNIKSGGALLYLHEVTGDSAWLAGAGLLARQLKSHPRTRSGVYWHKLRYPWQIWLDGLYMAAPFQVAYGQVTCCPDLVEDAVRQIGTALDQTFVPNTGLYAHGVDEAREQLWADPQTGLSKAHWARALGWLAMCLVDVADLTGPQAFLPLKARTQAFLTRIERLQHAPGLWLQVIDAPDLEGNYIETSASAMFVYALLRARALGLLDPVSPPDLHGGTQAPPPSGAALRGGTADAGLLKGLTEFAMTPGLDGSPRMSAICEVAGLGGFEGTYRDGSAAYYLSEPVVSNDSKGVGPLMMCTGLALAAARDDSRLVEA